MPAARRVDRRRGRLLPRLLLVLVAALVAWIGPRLVRAHAALQWTRYHAAQPADSSGQHARGAARWAAAALTEAAPLPWGAIACRLALEVGAAHEVANPAASRAVYEQLRRVLETLSQSPWRKPGLASLLDETRRLERQLGTPPPAPEVPADEAPTPNP